MKSSKIIFITVVVILIAGGLVWRSRVAKVPKENNGNNNGGIVGKPAPESDIIVATPAANQVISSPVQISGKAKGSWFFEATFPVKLLDDQGKVLASGIVRAQGDWQTADFVDFSGNLLFMTPTSTRGSLQFSKDNPSGLPENDKSFFVPVEFNHQTSQQSGSTCSPDLGSCSGDAKLCMEQNKNASCN
jgi:hypothetical protein